MNVEKLMYVEKVLVYVTASCVDFIRVVPLHDAGDYKVFMDPSVKVKLTSLEEEVELIAAVHHEISVPWAALKDSGITICEEEAAKIKAGVHEFNVAAAKISEEQMKEAAGIDDEEADDDLSRVRAGVYQLCPAGCNLEELLEFEKTEYAALYEWQNKVIKAEMDKG